MSEFLWRAIEETEGLDAVVELERERGYLAAQEQVTTYLSDRDWRPLADLLAERLKEYDPTTWKVSGRSPWNKIERGSFE
jgi:hypothetical protein